MPNGLRKISREDIPEQGQWVEKIIGPINAAIEALSSVDSGLSLASNMVSQEYEFDVTVPNTPATLLAHYTASAGTVVPNATATTINFGSKSWDTHSAVTTGASWKFTAPYAGTYRISAGTGANFTTANAYFDLFLIYNGAALQTWSIVNPVATSDMIQSSSTSIYLAKGDTVAIQLYQQSGASVTTYTGVNAWITIQCSEIPAVQSCWPVIKEWKHAKLGEPRHVIVTKITSSDSTEFFSMPVKWSYRDGNIRFENMAGLMSNKKYKIRALAILR